MRRQLGEWKPAEELIGELSAEERASALETSHRSGTIPAIICMVDTHLDWSLSEAKEVMELMQDLEVQATLPPGCIYQSYLSRSCERGTHGCNVRHG